MKVLNKNFDNMIDTLMSEVKGTEHEPYLVEMRGRYIFLLERLATLQDGAQVIDVGASPGLFTELMRRSGLDATGLDLYPDKRFPAAVGQKDTNLFLEKNIPVVKTDVVNAPFPLKDNSVDAAMMNETIEHLVGSPLPPLLEIHRVLKPGGKLFMSTPNVSHLANRLRFLAGKNIYTPLNILTQVPVYKCHNREYTMSDLYELMGMAGFRVVESGCYNFGGAPRSSAGELMRKLYYAVTSLWPSAKTNLYICATPEK